VIEWIFSILKQSFHVLLSVSPKFDKTTQAKLIPALVALHNFHRLNDDVEEENWDPDAQDFLNTPDPFWFPRPEPFDECQTPIELTAADLSVGITADETELANTCRDEIAACMWASYQAYLVTHV